jgi:polyphosphate glucokinase
VVLGGGNVKKLKTLPRGCRGGDNADAFLGGFRLWEEDFLPRTLRKKALFAVPKKPRLKTPRTKKDTKGAAA